MSSYDEEHRALTRKDFLKGAAVIAPVPALLGGGLLASTVAGTAPQAGADVTEVGHELELTPQCDDGDPQTPAQTEGPYFTSGSPERTDLVEPNMPGTRLSVTGVVYTRTCYPVDRAKVDFWQCDNGGNYDNVGYRLRGHQYTGADGRFRLSTIVPGLYPGRTRHIHVKVQAPNQPVLTSQLYFPNEPGNARDSLYDPRLEMVMRDVSGGREGTYDFVLNISGPPPTTTTTLPPPTTTTTTAPPGGITGTVNTGGYAYVNIRSGPGSSYPIVGRASNGQTVAVGCQTTGSYVSGPKGYSNKWDRLTSGYYIADTFVRTSSTPPPC